MGMSRTKDKIRRRVLKKLITKATKYNNERLSPFNSIGTTGPALNKYSNISYSETLEKVFSKFGHTSLLNKHIGSKRELPFRNEQLSSQFAGNNYGYLSMGFYGERFPQKRTRMPGTTISANKSASIPSELNVGGKIITKEMFGEKLNNFQVNKSHFDSFWSKYVSHVKNTPADEVMYPGNFIFSARDSLQAPTVETNKPINRRVSTKIYGKEDILYREPQIETNNPFNPVTSKMNEPLNRIETNTSKKANYKTRELTGEVFGRKTRKLNRDTRILPGDIFNNRYKTGKLNSDTRVLSEDIFENKYKTGKLNRDTHVLSGDIFENKYKTGKLSYDTGKLSGDIFENKYKTGKLSYDTGKLSGDIFSNKYKTGKLNYDTGKLSGEIFESTYKTGKLNYDTGKLSGDIFGSSNIQARRRPSGLDMGLSNSELGANNNKFYDFLDCTPYTKDKASGVLRRLKNANVNFFRDSWTVNIGEPKYLLRSNMSRQQKLFEPFAATGHQRLGSTRLTEYTPLGKRGRIGLLDLEYYDLRGPGGKLIEHDIDNLKGTLHGRYASSIASFEGLETNRVKNSVYSLYEAEEHWDKLRGGWRSEFKGKPAPGNMPTVSHYNAESAQIIRANRPYQVFSPEETRYAFYKKGTLITSKNEKELLTGQVKSLDELMGKYIGKNALGEEELNRLFAEEGLTAKVVRPQAAELGKTATNRNILRQGDDVLKNMVVREEESIPKNLINWRSLYEREVGSNVARNAKGFLRNNVGSLLGWGVAIGGSLIGLKLLSNLSSHPTNEDRYRGAAYA